MPRKRYQAPSAEEKLLTTETQLPIHRPLAIYYRQSTDEQVGNISTTVQTVDMVNHIKRYGWDEKNIIMIDMDEGVSGTKKIDEREGMSTLFSLITQDKIGAVACQDEDRLFRDVTQIQVNIFIEACKMHKVLVITPSMIYNFSHEQMGTFHARQFRFRSEMAADYIDTVIRGKLLSAKRSLSMRGRWTGSPMPVGFMVDTRKTLPDGTKNDNWRNFEVFEPYASVVREYYRLYLFYSGCIRKTLRHIHKHGPFFPNPAECSPPEGYRVVYRIKPNTHGWCIKSVHALGQMLTHAAYAGHWVVDGSIVKWNNHPPIVDEATFFRSFNYLSPIDLNGKKNKQHKSYARNVRPSLDEERDVDRPLFAGMIFSFWEGKLKAVGTRWRGKYTAYDYTFVGNDGYGEPLWQKRADYIDASVSALLLEKIKLTFDYDTWSSAIQTSLVGFDEQRKLKKSQLQQLKTVMDNLVTSLTSLSAPQLIAAVEKKYEAAQEEFDRLQAELSVITSDEEKLQRFEKMKNNFEEVLARWELMTTDEKREVAHAFVDKLEVTQQEDRTLSLEIFWKDGSTDQLMLEHLAGNGTRWLPQEVQRLIELVESGAGKNEIASVFPDRQWIQIANKYRYITKKPLRFPQHGLVKKYETYNEYIVRTKETDDEILVSELVGQRHRYVPFAVAVEATQFRA